MDSNQEFINLLGESGWSQAEAARQLDLPPPSVSRYLSQKDTPSKQTLRLFRLLLLDKANDSKAQPMMLRDEPPDKDELTIWRDRAKIAERELEELRQALRALIDRPRPKPTDKSPAPEPDRSFYDESKKRLVAKAFSKS